MPFKIAEKVFYEKFKRKLNSIWYWSRQNVGKRSKGILERVRLEHEKSISNEFFASKVNRVRALTDLYSLAKQSKELTTCHNIVRTLNEMFEQKKDGSNFYIQNNEYINMTVPELKKEIRLLSRRIGPELLRLNDSGLDKETSHDSVDAGDEDAGSIGETEKINGDGTT